MKSIRSIALSTLLTLGAFSAVTYTACNKDACKDVVCNNGGTCNDGNCSCPTGYEGTKCETTVRAKFEKTWTASDKTVADNKDLPTYTVTIIDGTNISDVKISHQFSDSYFNNDIKATVSGNTITIAEYQPDNDGYTISGTGTYNSTDKKLTWSYTVKEVLTNKTISYSGTWQ